MGIVLKQSLKNTFFIYLGFAFGGINTLFLYTRFLEDEYYGLVTFLLSIPISKSSYSIFFLLVKKGFLE